MRSTCKICFFVSLIAIVCGAFSLLRADIHEGTGQLMGTADYCKGDCKDGGDSCNKASSSNCGSYSTSNCGSGHCADKCKGTQGSVCSESSSGAVMCKDGAGTCADSSADKCVKGKDMFGYDVCKCTSEETVTVDCGDAYNKCYIL